MKQRNWEALVPRIAVILGALLVVLVSIALVYIVILIFQRFGDILALFILGALIAYVLNPVVEWVAARTGKRWVGTLVVYVCAAAALGLITVSLVQPLVTESSSLVRALRNPTAAQIRVLTRMMDQSHALGIELRSQRVLAEGKKGIPQTRVDRADTAIAGLRYDLATVGATRDQTETHPLATRSGATLQAQVRVPPSYLAPLQQATAALAADYQQAVQDPAAPALAPLTRSIADAARVTSEARTLHSTLSTTPILLLEAQTWADQHNVRLNVSQTAGQAAKQVTSQIDGLLNNTAAILSRTASVLLDLVLILIISVYFVSDGESMLQGAVARVPAAYHERATFFIESVNSVLGGYIRAQIVLALLAGVLAGAGAAVLGVPYALIIGVSTFFLQLIPVIGSMVVYIIPMVIALLFTSMPTPALLLGYLIVMEQLVTNVIGPRVNSKSVGIHPLEAMVAALLGYSIAGVLGSFLAVPFVGLVHVLAREVHNSWQTANQAPGASATSRVSTQDDSSIPNGETASFPATPSDRNQVQRSESHASVDANPGGNQPSSGVLP